MAATDTLTINVSAQSYEGDPQFVVKADGFQIGEVYTTGAQLASGQSQAITLTGDLSHAHQISVTFLNDFNPVPGNADADRNLYVNSITYDGQTFPGAALYETGSAVTVNVNGYVGPYTINGSFFGTLTTDPHSAGGEVYALYEGLLGRAPDTAGLEYWADQFNHGASPATLTSAFLASAEGQARLGAADNTGFVQQLYQNTLHRAPDSAGLSYWTDQLAHGASRVDVADSFVFSPEFTNNTVQPAISSGLFVPDAQASEVARIYYTMLGRAPDAGGLQYWTDQIEHGGGTASSVAQAFLGTPENQAKYGSLSNGDYVDALYVNALGRHADSGGLAYWTAQLSGGESRADLAVQLSQSPEGQNAHLAQIEQGWHLA